MEHVNDQFGFDQEETGKTNGQFPAEVLIQYLKERGFKDAETLSVRQFLAGHSNLTFLLRSPTREYVLRRAPIGRLAPKAHDVVREYRVLKAIHPFFHLAPAVVHLCEDASIIGAPFFLMERRHGKIIRGQVPPSIAAQADFQQRIGRAFVDCLIEMHGVDIHRSNLIALGRPEKYLSRQLEGWIGRWNLAKTEENPHISQLLDWLIKKLPPSAAPALIHNDFKMDNLMFNEDRITIEAVLDWEMATVGDPLTDLGYAWYYWGRTTDPANDARPFTAEAGWPTGDELVH